MAKKKDTSLFSSRKLHVTLCGEGVFVAVMKLWVLRQDRAGLAGWPLNAESHVLIRDTRGGSRQGEEKARETRATS